MQINTQSKFNPFRSWLIYTLIIFSSLGWCGDQETRALTNIEREISINSFLQYESNPPINYLLYRGFAIKYLCDQHVPEYALHIISPGNISLPEGQSPAKRRSTFFVDDHQVRDCSAIPYDYKGSGYDRGHLVPAGDYVWNKFLKDETFVYSNIFPQSANLNRGIWRHLEDCVRRYSSENGVKLILITGGLYDNEDPHTIGKRGLEVPTHTYKIIFCIFIVIGSGMSLGSVFTFGDVMIFAMCFPNVAGLYFLAPEIRSDLKSYMARIKSGEIQAYK